MKLFGTLIFKKEKEWLVKETEKEGPRNRRQIWKEKCVTQKPEK